jgi:hypothetical protein
MATRTSTQSGDWSDTATWGGSAAPGDGDIAVVATGHTVTVAANATVGSNSSDVGHAVQIQATNSSVFGSTISCDVAGDFSSVIDNRGHLSADGVTFTVPSGNVTWATNVASEAVSALSSPYEHAANLRAIALANPRVANSANTGLGSFGDTSLSFSSPTPAGILTTEVSSIAAVNSAGEYYVNYDNGVVILYSTQASNTATAAYKRLTLSKTWGIRSNTNTTGHSHITTDCIFEYMGAITAAESRAVALRYKQTNAAAGSNTRLGVIDGCTFRYCNLAVGVEDCTGTSGDPFTAPSNCTFGYSAGSTSFGFSVTSRLGINAYWQMTGNTLNVKHQFLTVRKFIGSATVPDQYVGFKLNNNDGTCGQLAAGMSWANVFPDGQIQGNDHVGLGPVDDARWCTSMGGTSGAPLVISGNTLSNLNRWIHTAPYLTVEENYVHFCPHHGITGPTEDDVYVPDVTIQNNLYRGNFTDGLSASAFIETGYNHRHHLDNWRVVNNTIYAHPQGVFSFGDVQDNAGNVTITRIAVVNNLVTNASSGGGSGGQAAIQRASDTTARVIRVHCLQLDNNLAHNVTATYEGTGVKGGTFSKGGSNYSTQTGGSRNVTGASLHCPSYGSSQSGITLAYTHTSATDRQLTLTDSGGAGSGVQLVFDNGNASAVGAHATQGASGYRSHGTFTDSSQAWSETENHADCPRGYWLLITADATTPSAVGQMRVITNNTATVLTVVPAWTALPSADADYVIIKSEVTLTAGSAETIRAGIYLPDFPTSTVSDTTISYALNDVTSDPTLANPTGTSAEDFELQSGSPAIDVGVDAYAPDGDYFGTSRDSSPDIGFFEFDGGGVAAAPTRSLLGVGT